MIRRGKIARLPKDVRDVVNKRLEDGHPAQAIAVWLNEQPVVQAVLAREFDGEPINHANMHAWVKGGFVDWKRGLEQSATRGSDMAYLKHNIGMLKAVAKPEMVDDLVLLFAASLGTECIRLEGVENGGERVKALKDVVRAFAELRSAQLNGGRAQLELQKAADLKQAAQQVQKQAEQKRQRTPEETQAEIRRIMGV